MLRNAPGAGWAGARGVGGDGQYRSSGAMAGILRRRRALGLSVLVSCVCLAGFTMQGWTEKLSSMGRWTTGLRFSGEGLYEGTKWRDSQGSTRRATDSLNRTALGTSATTTASNTPGTGLAAFDQSLFASRPPPTPTASPTPPASAPSPAAESPPNDLLPAEDQDVLESGGQSLSGMLQVLDGSSEDLPVEAMRDYLNGLVEESIARKSDQLSNIAFIKTHKTASTTLASILYRYGKRHDSNISKFREEGTVVDLDSAAAQVEEQGKRVDIMHYHHAWDGFYDGTWKYARSKYAKIMSDQADVNFVTVLREPIAHYLSYYYYFVNPNNKLSIGDYLMKSPQKKLLYNPLAAEFGIKNMAQMNDFIRNEMPRFKMVVLTERFDEGLALLQKMLNWDPIDITYCKMLQTKKGEKRWDGKPLENVPKIRDLRPEVLAQIRARTQLDTRLYQAGILLYRKYKLEFGPGVQEHFESFQGLQKVMHRYLEVNATSDALKWYVGDVDIYQYGPPVLKF